MGRVKGKVAFPIYPVKKGSILYDILVTDQKKVIIAAKKASYKLRIKTIILLKNKNYKFKIVNQSISK